MDLVIVESPAKAKTINKYLGKNYKVLASVGHIRDLSDKTGSIDPEDSFAMTWVIHPSSKPRIQEISDYLKKANTLFLATDPDREGEAISWHVLEVLRQKKLLEGKQIKRVVFNAITRNSVLEAMDNSRDLDEKLVDAYLARRALDYLVGYTLSPVLWRKLPGARSAGRVQSVALRIICKRELQIEQFNKQEYWSISCKFHTPKNKELPTRLTHLNGIKLDKFSLSNQQEAKHAHHAIEKESFEVSAVETKPGQRKPATPFTTSTLQQEAARKFGFSAKHTMQIAQSLYQGTEIEGEDTGLITYMRTDGQQIVPEAITEIRHVIDEDFGADYLPKKPREYKTLSANSQEAHEAIRPTSAMRRPEYLYKKLRSDEAKLYDLIWKRTIASQMENARVERTVIEACNPSEQITLRASGTVIIFPSFLKLYEEGQDDTKKSNEEVRLPQVSKGMKLKLIDIFPEQHFTEPPARYSEATLVKKMEELGIGRPSTYANILGVLRERDYVFMEQKRFKPHDKGRLVISFLESFFDRYVEYDFTAKLESDLDQISNGSLAYKDVLYHFWEKFSHRVDTILDISNTQVLDKMNEVLGTHIFQDTGDGNPRNCPKCDKGQLSLKTGRFGAFVGCTEYPECKYTRPFAQENEQTDDIERELGHDPVTQNIIYLKEGRFGPYIQLGDKDEDNPKPKRSGLPKEIQPIDLDLEYALRLLSLPKIIGQHPELKKDITAELGRYGPYLKCEKQSVTLENTEALFSTSLEEAILLLKNSKKTRTTGSNIIKELGEHPNDSKPINVMKGRYGPYVKHNKTNATIPKDEDPEYITLERALELIIEREKKV